MSLRIRLWPTLFTLVGLAIVVSLGTWQLDRYLSASEFEQQRDERIDDPVVPIESIDELADGERDFRRVKVEGVWDETRLFLIRHRVYDGDPGYWVVLPLHLWAEDTTLLVNRGWLPREEAADRAGELLEETGGVTETVSGLVHALDDVVADDDIRRRIDEKRLPSGIVELDSYDVAAMHDALSSATPNRPIIIAESEESSERDYPVASQEHITDPYLTADTHFGYMLTWYLLALALIGIWLAHAAGALTSRAYDDST